MKHCDRGHELKDDASTIKLYWNDVLYCQPLCMICYFDSLKLNCGTVIDGPLPKPDSEVVGHTEGNLKITEWGLF